MKLFKNLYFIICLLCLTVSNAQDVSINILNQPASVTQGSTGIITVDICNNDGGTRNVPLNKLRPLITLPSALVGATIVPISNDGWSIFLPITGSSIRFENTATIIPGECSQITFQYTGVNVGGPLTVTGTMAFNGPQTVGNITGNDNSTTSITVVACNITTPTVASTVQPTCSTPTGTITFTTQTGVEYSIGSGYQASPIFTSVAPGTYTLSVRDPLNTTCTTNAASQVTINPGQPTVPTVASTVQPTCSTPTGTITFTTQTGVEYSIGSGYQASPIFTSVAPGTYTLSVRNSSDATCITNAASQVTINPGQPTVPTVASTVQPTCSTPTGTITFTTQTGVEYSIGSGYQASPIFTSVAPGTYTLSVRNSSDATCITNAASQVTINPGQPTVPTVASTVQPTCSTPTGTITFTTQTGVEYSIGSGYQASPIFTSVAPGTYTLSVRNSSDATCITNAASQVTINPGQPTVPTVASTVQPTCSTPTGTITFTTQTGVEYSIGSGYQASPIFTSVAPGTYTLSVRNSSDATCITNAASQVTINPGQPAVPTVASTVQPTCSTPTGTITFTTQTGVEYSIGSGYQASPIFTSVAPGTYTLSVRDPLNTTCTTNAASQVTINPGQPTVPTVASTVQPTCSTPTGIITFTTQTGVEYSIGSGYQASPIFTSVAPGTYTLSVRNSSDATCITNAASQVTINPGQPTVPTVASTVQPTCSTPTGTITFTTQTGVEYSIGSGYQASPIFTSVAPGTYTLSVRNSSDATCITNAASQVTINPGQPTVPTVASTVQPTCSTPTGTITFTTQTGVEYSIGSGYQASPIFTSVAPGTYTLSVRDPLNTTCTTNAASQVTINPGQPTVPTVASTVQPTCSTPTGTITFTTQTGVEYSIGSGYQASPIFTSVAPGTYTLSVRNSSDATCITNAASQVTINPGQPTVPTVASTVQPTCSTPTGTITFTTQTGVEYSIGSGYQASPIFTSVAPGTYTLSVRNSSDATCITNAASQVTINPGQPTVPTVASTVQPTCSTPTGTITFTTQTGVEYSIGSGYQASPIFTSVAPGTYTLSVRNSSDATCITNAASQVTINPGQPTVPTVASTVQPTCSTPTGTITFTTQTGVEYSIGSGYQASPIFTSVAPGTYTLSVRNSSDATCITNAASQVTINPGQPTVPTVASTVQPTCSTPTGTITFTTQTGVEYSIGSGYQASPIFTSVAPGTYTLSVRDPLNTTCTTNAASQVTINPGQPTVPTVASTVQPTCSTPTGIITFTTQTGVEYSIGSGYQASPIFTSVAPGTYTLSVRNSSDATCITNAASQVTINPGQPTVPTVASTVQPTCSTPTGTITFTTQTGVQYSIDGTNYFNSPIFTNVAPGTYTLSVRDSLNTTCTTNAASPVTIILSCLIAVDDPSYSTPSSTTVTNVGNVTANDTLNGVLVTAANTDVTPITTGPLSIDANGVLTLAANTPSGTYPITYQICVVGASPANCDTAIATVVVLNNAPVPLNDTTTISEGNTASLNILSNDTDVDGQPTTTSGHTVDLDASIAGIQNTITTAQGTFTYDPLTGIVTFVPISINFNGIASIPYTLCDTQPLCNVAQINITVTPVNDAPVAINDINNTLVNIVVTGNVITNDFDIDSNVSPEGNVLTVTPQSLTVAAGTFDLLANGSYTFVPTAGYTGTVVFPYTLNDNGTPSLNDTANLTIIVSPFPIIALNSPPIANNDENLTFVGATVSGTVINNDSDPNGNALIVNTTPTVLPTQGSVTLNADGTYTYIPNPTATGVDTFTYSVCDNVTPPLCTTAVVTINIIANPGGNTPPLAVDDFYVTPVNTPITTGNVLLNDADPNGVTPTSPRVVVPLTPTITTAAGGTVSSINANGTFVYTPPSAIYVGPDSFVYTISDSGSPTGTASATVHIIVVSPVSPIDAVEDDYTIFGPIISEAGAVFDVITRNDMFNGNPITTTNIQNGIITYTINNNNGISGLAFNANGQLVVPAGTPPGVYNVSYTICVTGSTPPNCDTTVVVFTVADFKPYNFITPDGDGDNDTFFVRGIEMFKENTVEIYNRWGVKVFEVDGYDNSVEKSFKGISEGRVTMNEGANLPDGTYFYFVKYKLSDSTYGEKQGYLYLRRN